MAYRLKEVTIETSNTQEGIKHIEQLWQDVSSGKLPIIFDSENNFQNGISPISRYSNYESDEKGNYDLSILGVTSDFFAKLENGAKSGKYKKYEFIDTDISSCTKNAWKMVWKEQKEGAINRAYKVDYESTVPPEYTKDNKAHCYLWISIN